MARVKMQYAGGAVETTLTGGDLSSGAMSMTVASTTGFPSSGVAFSLTLDQGDQNLQETVRVTSYSGLTLTLDQRGWDGTTAQTHKNGCPVVHTPDADTLTDIETKLWTMTSVGDLPYLATASGAAWGRLAIGANGTVLQSNGTLPAWVANPATLIANNLSDVANAATARTNLGLGTAATHAATDFALVANNLSDLASATTARTNLGLGTIATHAASEFPTVANNLSDLASATTARTNLGLGTIATHAASEFPTVANNLSDLANAGTARTNLGLGTAATQAISAFSIPLVKWSATSTSYGSSYVNAGIAVYTTTGMPSIAGVTGFKHYLVKVTGLAEFADTAAHSWFIQILVDGSPVGLTWQEDNLAGNNPNIHVVSIDDDYDTAATTDTHSFGVQVKGPTPLSLAVQLKLIVVGIV